MRKLAFLLTLLVGIAFVGAGGLILTQGLQAQTDVKNSIAAEQITLGTAEKPDGTRDEVVAKYVPAQYQGMKLVDVGKPEALLWQKDVIRGHTLAYTKGKVFTEMPRMVPKLDENGNQVMGEDGKPVMVPNVARDIWTLSTTLQSALLQGYMAWRISELLIGLGVAFMFLGVTLASLAYALRR